MYLYKSSSRLPAVCGNVGILQEEPPRLRQGESAGLCPLRDIGYGVRSDFELNFGRYLPGFGQADKERTEKQTA